MIPSRTVTGRLASKDCQDQIDGGNHQHHAIDANDHAERFNGHAFPPSTSRRAPPQDRARIEPLAQSRVLVDCEMCERRQGPLAEPDVWTNALDAILRVCGSPSPGFSSVW